MDGVPVPTGKEGAVKKENYYDWQPKNGRSYAVSDEKYEVIP